MKLTVNKVVFLNARDGNRFAWYLSVVKIDGKSCCFWSNHNCTGMRDIEAATAFEREHYQEVSILIEQKMKNEIIITNN